MNEFLLNLIKENQVLIGFIGYSAIEYYFGKTDKVKEGSLIEFLLARVKNVFVKK